MLRQNVSSDFPTKRPSVPTPHSHAALSVTDGTVTVGHIVPHHGAWFAFDADDALVGKYPTQHQAVLAIPHKRTRAGQEDRRGEKVDQGETGTDV